MKNTRMLLILALAIICGLAAGYSALRYLSDRPTPIVSTGADETVPVVLAARDLQLGHVLEDGDLRVVEWPASAVPTGFASAKEEVVGQSLITDVQVNEGILFTKLAETGLRGLILLIEPGMRALTVRVDDVQNVAGFVTPRTQVDLILIMTPPGGSEDLSKIILQNILVLASGQIFQESPDGQAMSYTVATFLVTPEQAERLALASSVGQIRMALRNTLDLEPVQTTGERESRLFAGGGMGAVGTPVRTRAEVSSAQESIIEIYNGGVRAQRIRY
jgi:pilus assembly protein CpaB